MCRPLFFCNVDSCIAHRSHIKRLTNAIVCQQAGRKQFIRSHICKDRSFIYQYDTVYVSPENVFQTVLNDQNCRIRFFLDLIDQLNSLFSCCRIKICQRLIEQEDFYLIYHDTRKADSLLLSTREFMRCIIQMLLDSYQFCRMSGDCMHFILRSTTVFQSKCNILTNRQSDKLSIRILKNRSYMRR